KFRVGDLPFLGARHRQVGRQYKRSWRNAAAVLQRAAMMIPGDVKVSIAVDHNADGVVCISGVARELRAAVRPPLRIELSLCQDHMARGVIPRRVLLSVVCDQRVLAKHGGVYRRLRPAAWERLSHGGKRGERERDEYV